MTRVLTFFQEGLGAKMLCGRSSLLILAAGNVKGQVIFSATWRHYSDALKVINATSRDASSVALLYYAIERLRSFKKALHVLVEESHPSVGFLCILVRLTPATP